MIFSRIEKLLPPDLSLEGLNVEVVEEKEIAQSDIPEDVQEFMRNLIKDPINPAEIDSTYFGLSKMYTRNDGLVSYTAMAIPHPSLGIPNPIAMLVDYDAENKEIVGEALAEDTFLNEGFAELRVFDTYSKKRGHGLSYPRLIILNAYCVEALKRLLSSGEFTKKNESAKHRTPEKYSAGQHVWQTLKDELDKRTGPFVISRVNGTFFFKRRDTTKL